MSEPAASRLSGRLVVDLTAAPTGGDIVPPRAFGLPKDETSERAARPGSLLAVLALVLTWTVMLYAATFVVVRDYYTTHLPHYDSIGAYYVMYSIVNQAAAQGPAAAAIQALRIPITWLQPLYALLLAWAPVRAPEYLVTLNGLLLLVTQASIVVYLRTFGVSSRRQVLAAFLPIVPGALYAWDGGIQDLRRDPQLTLLLMGVVFASLAYVERPSWQRGLWCGIVLGLTQWSRDNAAAMLLLCAVPSAVVAFRRHAWTSALKLAIVPGLVFLLFAVPYYWMTFDQTLVRYTSTIWGVGEGRLASLRSFWLTPLHMLLGDEGRAGGNLRVAGATVVLLAIGLAGVAAGALTKQVRLVPRRLLSRPHLTLLGAGAYVAVAVVLYNCLLLGYGASWHAMPFQPTVVGAVLILVAALGAVERARPDVPAGPWWNGVVAAAAVTIIASAVIRMGLAAPPAVGAETVAAVRSAALDIDTIVGNKAVGIIWIKGFGRHHVRYYLAQAGLPPPREFESVANGSGDPIELERPLADGDPRDVLTARLERTIRRFADYVLVTTETAAYEDPKGELWPYRIGRPAIDNILADPDFVPVARFTLFGRPFVLLENRLNPRPGPPARAHAPASRLHVEEHS
ncbi:MAG: hypothetical protein IT306_05990 [Chloroflexi bacterium]|nr:hypothetical protein [Chloroflexota bacterium]